jgi:hypothetical protein
MSSALFGTTASTGLIFGTGQTSILAGTLKPQQLNLPNGVLNNATLYTIGNGTVSQLGRISGVGTLVVGGSAGQLNMLQLISGTGCSAMATLQVNSGSQLDLTNNEMDVSGFMADGNPPESLAQISTFVALGYSNGTWNGTGGIVSSTAAADTTHLTAIGVIQKNQSGTALFTASHQFDGTTPGAGDILIKYTYYGDTNLDGKVDGTDYSRIDNGYLQHLTGWGNGDFNYDGVVDGSDYTLIDNAFNAQGAQLSTQIVEPTAQLAVSTSASSVPEPTLLGLIAMVGIGLLGRRKRYRSFTV